MPVHKLFSGLLCFCLFGLGAQAQMTRTPRDMYDDRIGITSERAIGQYLAASVEVAAAMWIKRPSSNAAEIARFKNLQEQIQTTQLRLDQLRRALSPEATELKIAKLEAAVVTAVERQALAEAQDKLETIRLNTATGDVEAEAAKIINSPESYRGIRPLEELKNQFNGNLVDSHERTYRAQVLQKAQIERAKAAGEMTEEAKKALSDLKKPLSEEGRRAAIATAEQEVAQVTQRYEDALTKLSLKPTDLAEFDLAASSKDLQAELKTVVDSHFGKGVSAIASIEGEINMTHAQLENLQRNLGKAAVKAGIFRTFIVRNLPVGTSVFLLGLDAFGRVMFVLAGHKDPGLSPVGAFLVVAIMELTQQ